MHGQCCKKRGTPASREVAVTDTYALLTGCPGGERAYRKYEVAKHDDLPTTTTKHKRSYIWRVSFVVVVVVVVVVYFFL